MLLKYFKLLLIGLFLLIAGCIPIFPCKSKLSIEELPKATVNQPYFAKIEISGGAMPNESNIQWEATPEHSGLVITRSIDKNSTNGFFDGVEISGAPKFQGDITIQLYGGGYGYPPCYFNKTFFIKVNPPAELIKD